MVVDEENGQVFEPNEYKQVCSQAFSKAIGEFSACDSVSTIDFPLSIAIPMLDYVAPSN